MSVLSSLARAYDRLPDAPPFGFSSEKIGFCISLNEDGSVAHVIDLRDTMGKKPQPRPMLVPQPVKRTAGIAPNTFWDKTSYVLGVTAGEGKRTAAEHAAFVEHHETLLAETEDPGIKALLRFLKAWAPEQFTALEWPEEMKDQNVIFALESERLRNVYLHDRPAARTLWSASGKAGEGAGQICLVSGEAGPVARLHPSIKGVWGAQSSGAALVSFNLDAFTSYGHDQGENAPVSEAAAFKYTTALNRFLEKGSGHRLQIGDASTVFWADASDLEASEPQAEDWAERLFAGYFDVDPTAEEAGAVKDIGILLERIRKGEHLRDLGPGLDENIRFFVLGLAPNAARLSVRFYFEDSFGELTRHYQKFIEDMRIQPPPRDGYPPLWRYLRETAVLGKSENVPPNLAGEWMRSILSGTRYPLSLMSAVLTRIRADGEVNALRAGILKAILVRNFNWEAPVALDPDFDNRGYLLGRLFAAYENAQTAALGTKVNATIKDKFYGAASAQPRKVFALLDSGSVNHLSKVGKQSPGRRVNLEKLIASIMDRMRPDGDPFPASLSAAEQALFGLGYYHQRNEFFKKSNDTADAGEASQ
ncbi:type I-C CRISPR-associated protein Cas8c/Csd1 [Roseibium aggregatum]|uniref:Type I-C CRISPR-associated protein Cas8c/Csd1 n=1 Tax=Roseibium aggregatum TaxID=187304 RepID=A0A926P6H1_9HYPH|nr:type I-C CRISPR-associated protein Cas8c/Csd1 [Roseibium aggregatum]MBD1549416.1 type I-C CRISPR-associated protein Cas8c/Csd1 [Roseibium aggregatum]